MFTGIIEALGTITGLEKQEGNLIISCKSPLSSGFKIDQSVAHNGVCLTVTQVFSDQHQVVAIDETLQKTNLGQLQIGDTINLERAMLAESRLDGHFVQGHVDTVGKVISAKEQAGSWNYTISFDESYAALVIEKGSICLNGISLTCFNLTENSLEVAIIPYTYEHTQINTWREGSLVNIEFDILGKYLQRYFSLKK